MFNSKIKKNRFYKTINFLKKVDPNCKSILDLGVKNDLSAMIKSMGYDVTNTEGEDLDLSPESITHYQPVDVVTAFEIFEHLVSPFPLIKNLPANRLVATVPLKLWFAKAYRNKNDIFDMHYHEFESWQFDMLLSKAGWKVMYSEKWTSPTYQLGIRPLLRWFYPRFYAVYAVRK